MWRSIPMLIHGSLNICWIARAMLVFPDREGPFRITICPVLVTVLVFRLGGRRR
jgi:hypothetical protein